MINLTLSVPHEHMDSERRKDLHQKVQRVLKSLDSRGALNGIEIQTQKTYRLSSVEVAKSIVGEMEGVVYFERLKDNHEEQPKGSKRHMPYACASIRDFTWPSPYEFERQGYFFVVPGEKIVLDSSSGFESVMGQLGWGSAKVYPGVTVPTKELKSAFARVRAISKLSEHFAGVVRLESTGSQLIVTGVSAPAAYSREFQAEGPSFWGGAKVPSSSQMSEFGQTTIVSQVDGEFVLTSGSSQLWLESGLESRSMKHLKDDRREFLVEADVKELRRALDGLKVDKAVQVEFVGGHLSGRREDGSKVGSFYGLSGRSSTEVSCVVSISYLEKCLVGLRSASVWLGSKYLLIESVKDPQKHGQRILGTCEGRTK